jgi:hypothetical protein
MKLVLALAAILAFTLPAAAQHKHGTKGPNGGIVEDVAGVHAELLAAGNALTVNILDEDNKPLSAKGYTASALVVNGPDRETITLAPSGDAALKGETKKAIAPNTQVTLMIKTAAGKSGQARYRIEKK